MNEELENWAKHLDRFNMEFGRCLTFVSHVCAQCLEIKNERRSVAIDLDHFLFMDMEFQWVSVPLCKDCEMDKLKILRNIVETDYTNAPHIEAIVV